jgi:hypothetical protein
VSHPDEQSQTQPIPEQPAKGTNPTEKNSDAVELRVTELEERIAPSCVGGKHLPTGGITV